MTPRAQLRRLMSDVDMAADNADRALQRLKRTGVVAVPDNDDRAGTQVRAGLVLASLAMAAKLFAIND
ncbi:hypothetical protein [Stappia sp.]|uniref:hypothetical protein n=1 Tax=Stappia sp. TaxID=1870903 RepID=UPI0032D8C45D